MQDSDMVHQLFGQRCLVDLARDVVDGHCVGEHAHGHRLPR